MPGRLSVNQSNRPRQPDSKRRYPAKPMAFRGESRLGKPFILPRDQVLMSSRHDIEGRFTYIVR